MIMSFVQERKDSIKLKYIHDLKRKLENWVRIKFP